MDYVFKMDSQILNVSESLKGKIYSLSKQLISKSSSNSSIKKRMDAEDVLNKYNLSDEERSKIEDTNSIFDDLGL